MDLARAPRRTARKKGFGYENDYMGTRMTNFLLSVQIHKGPASGIGTLIMISVNHCS
jgi:hypothetical protein